MSRTDTTQYSVSENYSVSTSLKNIIIERNSDKPIETENTVINQPKELVSVILSTNPQDRDIEDIKYNYGSNVKLASDVDMNIDHEKELNTYSSSLTPASVNVANLEGENIHPDMDDLMGE